MITKEEAEYIFENLAYRKKTYKEMSSEFNVHMSTLCKWMSSFKKEFGMENDEKYSANTFLRYKYRDEIIKKYNNGESTSAIAKYYGFSDDHMIAELLRKLNIEVRGVGYQSRTNQNLFNIIDNELIAYTLGLITSDGNIGNNYMISITLTESDKYLLEEINNRVFNNSGSIIITGNKEKATCRLSICGKRICESLVKYGVVPNKSHLLTNLYKFDEPIMKHYIRGLYDGDGVCSKSGKYLRVGYCAHKKEFVEDYQRYLSNLLNIKSNKLFNTGGCWDCSWGAKEDLIKIYDYLYKDATIFLSRKQQKLFNYLYGNTEVSS